jgi:hypothetical protein
MKDLNISVRIRKTGEAFITYFKAKKKHKLELSKQQARLLLDVFTERSDSISYDHYATVEALIRKKLMKKMDNWCWEMTPFGYEVARELHATKRKRPVFYDYTRGGK